MKKESIIKAFFGSNAVMSVVILGLITIFLFKEGIEFFGQYRDEMNTYRSSGMEYANVVSKQHDSQTLLFRYLEGILANETKFFDSLGENSEKKIQAETAKNEFLKISQSFQTIKESLLNYEKKVVKWAAETKLFLSKQKTILRLKKEALSSNLPAEDFNLSLEEIENRTYFSHKELESWYYYFTRHEREDLAKQINPSIGSESGTYKEKMISNLIAQIQSSYKDQYLQISQTQAKDFRKLFENFDGDFSLPESQNDFSKAKEAVFEYLNEIPDYEKRLSLWNPDSSFPLFRAVTGFLLGTDWVTNSARQDWYGVLPLFSGSLLVTLIALVLAIPLGVGSAIYINQIASKKEQAIIKPSIEFISAIPSVVIGFFGIAVLGGIISEFTNERLNSLTAGCLLALMTVPTIFTLAEDALNNVPRALRDASLSLGANQWQTCIKIIVPSAITGIISAILLGLGRVIGETMVVLLCAGNRIAIPDFTSGLGVFAQPVHTMTGIIAQEMGEVEFESIHYRALFMVGVVLFTLSLSINFLSQTIAGKYKANY